MNVTVQTFPNGKFACRNVFIFAVTSKELELQTICLKCGQLDIPFEATRLKCRSCSFAITRQRYVTLMKQGREIFLFGFKYRIEYEAQFAKHGRIATKYSFWDPTFVEAAVSVIVSGIVGNTAHDLVKTSLTTLYVQLKRRRLKSRPSSTDRGLCAQDIDFVYRLIGNDPGYSKTFFGYAVEYAKGKKARDNDVFQALEEEYAFDQLSDICRNDPSVFVFASRTGKRFHRKNCKFLRAPSRKMRLKVACLIPLTPCLKCKPI
jgi:hypothetical protein